MKFLSALLVFVAVGFHAGAADTNTAAFAGWCRSLALQIGDSLIAPGGAARVAFSSHDGVANTLLVEPSLSIVSDELRPRAAASGTYEVDYGLFRQAAFFEIGSMTLTLPGTDADTNGVPDIVQVNQAGHASMISGSGRQEGGGASSFPLNASFSRNAGADLGSYSFAWTNGLGAYAFAGNLRVLHLSGLTSYSRGKTNHLQFQFTLHDETGSSLVLTGATTYTARSAGEVTIPSFKLRSGSRQYTVQPTTLARAGHRYTGTLRLLDGLLETYWRDYTDWAVEITDTTDANTNGVPDFSDPLAAPDFTPPKVFISVPVANARISNANVIVQGTASDDRLVTEVLYSLNGGAFTNASGTNLWLAPITLLPGTNTFAVKSVDGASNVSAVVTRKFIHVVTSPLDLQITGAGSVTPNYDGRLLEVGRRYTLTATPAVSNLFAFWSGDTSAVTATLTFTMVSNMVLIANFVPNPFLPLKGAYTGLFAEPANILHETSGHFSATLRDKGAFSATLRRAGRTLAFSEQFALDGKATNRVRLSTTNQLLVLLSLDLVNGTEQITGTLDDGLSVASLTANRTQPRSPGNPAGRWPGRYTVDLASLVAQPDLTVPGGAGVATVTANTNGTAVWAVTLPDGTKVAAPGALSKDGAFPFYAALYGGKGSIFSPMTFTNDGAARIFGLANWSKPSRPLDARYRGGFTNVLDAHGSLYSRTEVTNALAAGAASVAIHFLPTPDSTNFVTWNRATRLTNSAGFSVTLNPANGLWTGVYPEPVSRQRLPFQATLQPAAGGLLGKGFLVQSNVSGLVIFTVAP